MPGSTGARAYGLMLIAASLLLAACNVISPATPTPTPAASAAAGRGIGGGGGGRGAGVNGQGQGQGQGRGQGQGQGQGRGQGQGPRAAQGDGQGQGQGQGDASGRPGAGLRGAGGPNAQGTPNPNSPIVNGEVDIIDGHTVTVATNTGWRKVEVPDSATILSEGTGTPADLVVGAMVGVTGKQDGTAVSIRMFPPGSTARTGQFPMQGAQAGNVMTNAKIEAFDGSKLFLDMNGEKASITVPADTEILKAVPAAFSDITLGARVQAMGTVNGDTLAANRVVIQAAQRNGRG